MMLYFRKNIYEKLFEENFNHKFILFGISII
jgi:hypothetical protein